MPEPDTDETTLALNQWRFDSSKQVDLLEAYKHSPTAKTLVAVLSAVSGGVAGGVESAAMAWLDNHNKLRFETLIAALAEEKIQITDELIKREQFIHSVLVVTKAAQRSRFTGKIRLYARLLAGYSAAPDDEFDEFDEFLAVLEGLSLKEFLVLQKLYELDRANPIQDGDNDLRRAHRHWDDLLAFAKERLRYDKADLDAVLTSLNRTGLYTTISGSFLGYTGNMGHLTSRFYKLAERLRLVTIEDADRVIDAEPAP